MSLKSKIKLKLSDSFSRPYSEAGARRIVSAYERNFATLGVDLYEMFEKYFEKYQGEPSYKVPLWVLSQVDIDLMYSQLALICAIKPEFVKNRELVREGVQKVKGETFHEYSKLRKTDVQALQEIGKYSDKEIALKSYRTAGPFFAEMVQRYLSGEDALEMERYVHAWAEAEWLDQF